MVTQGSGRCHGPGCTQPATVEFWCGERCQEVWSAQFGDQIPKMSSSRDRLYAAVDLLDAEDAAAARTASLWVTVPPGMAAVAVAPSSPGAKKAAEVERLNARLRAVFPDHADAAVAEANRRARSSAMTYAQAVESMWTDPPDFASESATYPLVASASPQVAESRRERRLRLGLHWWQRGNR